MTVGLVALLTGLVLIGWGSSVTRRRIRDELGSLDDAAIEAAEGAGIVPAWATVAVLGGWLLAVGGIVLVAVSFLT